MTTDQPRADAIADLTPDELRRIAAWHAGDDSVSLASLFEDAAAYADVSRALRAALAPADPTADLRAAAQAVVDSVLTFAVITDSNRGTGPAREARAEDWQTTVSGVAIDRLRAALAASTTEDEA